MAWVSKDQEGTGTLALLDQTITIACTDLCGQQAGLPLRKHHVAAGEGHLLTCVRMEREGHDAGRGQDV